MVCAPFARAATIRDDVPLSSYQNYSALSQFAASGFVEFNSGQEFGTGTLIAPDWVITAAHVVTQDTTGCPTDPASQVTFGQGASMTFPGNDVAAQVIAEPGWSYNVAQGNDLALIKLSTPVTNVPPAILYNSSLGTELGQTASIIGYGNTGTGLTGDTGGLGTRMGITNVVDLFGGSPSLPEEAVNTSSNLMYTDFDQPNNPSASLFGSNAPTSLEGCSTPGDSGGGLFLTVNGQTYLAGVTDFVAAGLNNTLSLNPDGHYGDYNGYTRLSVSQSAAFIDSTLVTQSSWAGGGGTWDKLSNWSGSNIPEFAGATASFGPAAAASTITLDAAWTAGTIAFNSTNSYTLAPGTGGSLALDNGGLTATAAITDNGGKHWITAPLALNSNLLVTVVNSGDALTIAAPLNGAGGLSLAGKGTLFLAASNSYAGPTAVNSGTLNISLATALRAGGTLTVGTSSTAATVQLAAGIGTITLSSLSINSGSTIDIANNAIAVNYTGHSPLAAIEAALATGYNKWGWNGTGIVSSIAAQDPTNYAVGVADGNVDALTAAQPNQVLIKYTLVGDALLQGSVGFNDLLVVAQHYGTSGNDWSTGNFTYDPHGSVGFSDLLYIAQNTGKSISSQALALSLVNVPEPGQAAAAGMLIGLAGARRRGKSCTS